MTALAAMLLLLADPGDGLAKTMLPIYVQEVRTYLIAVESDPATPLPLKKEPIFEWQNPVREDTQGTLFVWLRDGRPAAVACILSYPHGKLPGREVVHELHALDREKLVVTRSEFNQWKPQAGLERKELPDAPAPAATAGARLAQMRRLAQEFTGHSVDWDRKRWELRLLPTPLFRYPAAKAGVVDGALFALMSGGGTDPEVLILLEVREDKGVPRWEYACGRFSDWELNVSRKEKVVYESLHVENNPTNHDPLHLYRAFPEKVFDKGGKLLARVRQQPDGSTALHPAEDK